MKTIYHYRVSIADNTGIIGKENVFEVKQFDVLAENNRYIVISDFHFTTIDKRPEKYSIASPLEKESIGIHANDSIWGNRVTYSLYTFKKKRASSIRRAIEAAIKKQLGFFLNGIDLSVIQEPKGEEA